MIILKALKTLINSMEKKVHLIKEEYKTGERITHFKTVCGIIRHVCTSLPNTTDKLKVTCKVCLPKK